MGLDDALNIVRDACRDAINATPAITQKGQCVKGWPSATEMVKILAQTGQPWQVSVYPLPSSARNTTSILGEGGIATPPAIGITAALDEDIVTFGGAAAGPLNIFGFIEGYTAGAARIAVTTGTGPNAIATALSAAVNALAIPGVTCTPAGASATLSGAVWSHVNVGGTGSITTGEQGRAMRKVQVTIWASAGPVANNPDDTLRNAIFDAIKLRVGARESHFYRLPDTSFMYLMYDTDSLDDSSQSSYSLFAARIVFDMQFADFITVPATQVGDIVLTESVASLPSNTQHIGG